MSDMNKTEYILPSMNSEHEHFLEAYTPKAMNKIRSSIFSACENILTYYC